MSSSDQIIPRKKNAYSFSGRANSTRRQSRMLPINIASVNEQKSSFSAESPEPTISGHMRTKSHTGIPSNDLSDPQTPTVDFSRSASVHNRVSSGDLLMGLQGPNKRMWFPNFNPNDPNSNLITRRLQRSRERRSAEAQKDSQLGLLELQHTFASQNSNLTHVNWEFWNSVVSDYDQVARQNPEKLRKSIQEGFPPELRGILWQVIASSKSSLLEKLYETLSVETDVPCEAAINKDLNRTPMAKQVDTEALSRILKAYSLFDPDVGYTQGMAFIVVPLLMELGEVETFEMLVQLMKIYDFRSIFIADMPGLHLRLYQFERLIEDSLESLHIHLKRQGIHSTMYASQWFITMFSYRFPPSLVTRVFDIVIAEGSEALLRFAVALMDFSADKILKLNGLDQMLPFLKDSIFDAFLGNENELVRLASKIELFPQILSKYEIEYQEITRLERERNIQLDALRTSNVRLTSQNRVLEAALESLNTEHVQIANKMVETGLELANLRNDNSELTEKIEATKVEHKTYADLVLKVNEITSELAGAISELSECKRENKLLKEAHGITSTVELVKELNEYKEKASRYEQQLASLQESLASALEGH